MPKEGRIFGRKLLDYSLGLYAARPISTARLRSQSWRPARHRFVGYIEELLFTPELDYLPQVSPEDLRKIPQRQSDRAAQRHHCGLRDCGAAALHGDGASRAAPGFTGRGHISRTFWLLMHADSKDLARIRAVADYIYETVESDRALFSGR